MAAKSETLQLCFSSEFHTDEGVGICHKAGEDLGTCGSAQLRLYEDYSTTGEVVWNCSVVYQGVDRCFPQQGRT